MKELRLLCEKNGCAGVQTYIQSGNVIFRSERSDPRGVATRLTDAVCSSHGFEPRVMVLSLSELKGAVAGNPYRDAEEDPKSLHLFFLAAVPKKPDLKSLQAFRTRTERFALKGRIFYLHTPDGFGRSRLAERVERFLGVEGTARNWRTVTTLLEMASSAR
jgi:uncharacterized protein (DUF1697 family)